MQGLTYLGSHELWCATEGARCRAVPHLLFAQTVISNLDMPIHSEQNVIKFQIAVDDAILVEVL